MRHKDRVMLAFEGKRPDRVAIFEQAFASSVASRMLGRPALTGSTSLHYEESRAWMKGESAHDEFLEQCYQDTIALAKLLDFDALYMPWRLPTRPTRLLDEYTFLYGDENSGVWEKRSFDPVSQTYGVVSHGRPQTVEEVAQVIRDRIRECGCAPAVTPADLDPMRLRAIREYGAEYAIPGGASIAVPMQAPWLEATILERGLIEDYLDACTERSLSELRAWKAAGADYISGGADFADKNGPVYGPRFFREVMSPRWHRILKLCREISLPYVFRSDGNLWPVADELFGKIRPHGYGEIDWPAGMDAKKLRDAFPELTLFGNVPCGTSLILGTPEDVARDTRYVIDSAAPRLVLGSSNAILHGTPPENIAAMFETAKSYSSKLYRSLNDQDDKRTRKKSRMNAQRSTSNTQRPSGSYLEVGSSMLGVGS